jgi:hypothetical protein
MITQILKKRGTSAVRKKDRICPEITMHTRIRSLFNQVTHRPISYMHEKNELNIQSLLHVHCILSAQPGKAKSFLYLAVECWIFIRACVGHSGAPQCLLIDLPDHCHRNRNLCPTTTPFTITEVLSHKTFADSLYYRFKKMRILRQYPTLPWRKSFNEVMKFFMKKYVVKCSWNFMKYQLEFHEISWNFMKCHHFMKFHEILFRQGIHRLF